MYQKRYVRELEIIALYRSGYKKRFYLREISKLSKLPLKTSQNILANLEKSKILKSKVEGKNKYFSLNLDNIQAKSYLLQSEIYNTDLFLENYPQFKTFLKSLSTNTPLIIFGSFAKFKADKNSDVDILLISEKEAKPPFHLLPYKVHEIRMSEKEFAKGVETKETFIKEIEENHIMLNSHSYFVNIMWDEYAE